MKKILIILAILLISAFIVNAEFEDAILEDTGDYLGLGVSRNTNLFAVVGNNVCSEFPDTAKYISDTNKDGRICMKNTKTHPIIFQIFNKQVSHIACGSKGFIPSSNCGTGQGDVIIQPGETSCVTIPDRDVEYFYQIFWCDVPQVKCKEDVAYYTAGCDYDECNEGQVLRKRGLTELVSGGCNGWIDKRCVDDRSYGYICDNENQQESNPGDNGGGQIPGKKALNGEWQSITIPPQMVAGSTVELYATFEAFEAGNYYLEAGVFKGGTFSILAEKSKCDGAENFAGNFIEIDKGQSVNMIFKIKVPEKTGRTSVIIGAYSACLNNSGEKINTFTGNTKIIEAGSGNTGTGGTPRINGGFGDFIKDNLLWVIIGIVILIIIIITGITGVAFLTKK